MNLRRTNGSRRDKVRRRVLMEESVCWLCGQPVDKALGMLPGQHGPRCKGNGCRGCRPNPMRAEVDEVIPVSRGGSPYDRTNCRLTHRICNQRRGNKMQITGLAKPVEPIVTDREW